MIEGGALYNAKMDVVYLFNFKRYLMNHEIIYILI